MGRLRKWFCLDYEESWKALAAEMEGRYREGKWGSGSRVDLDVGGWTFTLDVYVVVAGKAILYFTRLRAPYVNPTGFRFDVGPESFFTRIGKAFGMQDVQVGVPEFDDRWLIQGTDEARVRRLFSAPELRELLGGAGEVSFAVKDDEGWFGTKFPDGVDELVLTKYGIVTDLAQLKLFFALFSATLEQLVATGDASAGDPGLKL